MASVWENVWGSDKYPKMWVWAGKEDANSNHRISGVKRKSYFVRKSTCIRSKRLRFVRFVLVNPRLLIIESAKRWQLTA